MAEELRRILWIWLALMVLLALTAGSAWLDLGGWNSTLNLLIAAAKALLVAWFFMELKLRDGLVRIAAGTGLAILLLLLGLSAADYGTRVLWRSPWQEPPKRLSGTAAYGRHLGKVQGHAAGGLRHLFAAAVAVREEQVGGSGGAQICFRPAGAGHDDLPPGGNSPSQISLAEAEMTAIASLSPPSMART